MRYHPDMPSEIVFTSARLLARIALPEDAQFFLRLWTHPKVMVHVGFPLGLRITLEEVQALLERDQNRPILERRLVVELLTGGDVVGVPIGECHLGVPDAEGIVETDVKLLPEFWGHRYGVEIKRALVDYLFTHTDCTAVQATPNVNNAASINMQIAAGAVRTGEGIFEFPPEQQAWTQPVHYYVYRVYREAWMAGRDAGENGG